MHFFSQGFNQDDGPKRTGEGAVKRKLKVQVLFFSDQKDWRLSASPPTPISPQNYLTKILR